jgi:hypothetical protein
MTRWFFFTATASLALLTTGCAPTAPGPGAELRMVPDTKEVIDVLFRSEALPMSVHPSCQAIAEAEGIETIGAFVGALLARQIEGGENWTRVRLYSADGPDEMLWRAEVTFRGSLKEPGVEFLIRPSTRRVIPSSFRCVLGS